VKEQDRHRIILRLLQERAIVSVADFGPFLGRSTATIRRDLAALASQGMLSRVRGGAVAVNPVLQADTAGRTPSNGDSAAAAQKRAIARVAAGLIRDDDSLILSAGTTTFALVEFLVHRRLDIMTNSLPIAANLLDTSENRLSMPGGIVFPDLKIVYSPLEEDATASFWASKMFLGCYGVNRGGVMEVDPVVAQAHVRLSKRAEQIIVLADSSKLNRNSSMIVLPLRSISMLITDDAAQESALEPFLRAGVHVIVASSVDALWRAPGSNYPVRSKSAMDERTSAEARMFSVT
jgi:DeoR family ulaG and ulaABCDEF operon transcriptional repressor